jgi:hypothetical protein
MHGGKLKLVLRWGGVNSSFFAVCFVICGILVALFPEAMLSVFGRWASLLSTLGARTGAEIGSQQEMFVHILQRNVFSALVYFAVGLLLQAPLAMLFSGPFYALVSLLAPYTVGRSFSAGDWLLILMEVTALIGSASLGSAIAGELYEVRPGVRSWWAYFTKSWRSLSMRPSADWRAVLRAWVAPLVVGVVVLAVLLVFVGWFETYGY